MPSQRIRCRIAVAGTAAAVLTGAAPAGAATDRRAPTTPTDFRVAGTDLVHGLARLGPRDRRLRERPLRAHRETALLPADLAAPKASTLSATKVGATHVALRWAPALDDGPFVSYTLFTPVSVGAVTAFTLSRLAPATTYTIAVQARDNWQNVSPPSDVVTVTTGTPDPFDATPPSRPANLITAGMEFPDGETRLFWDDAFDAVTPPSRITCRVLVDGVPDHAIVGQSETVLYAPTGRTSTLEVVAVDEAGNASAPASLSVTVP